MDSKQLAVMPINLGDDEKLVSLAHFHRRFVC